MSNFNPYQAPQAAVVGAPGVAFEGERRATRGSRLAAAFLDGLVGPALIGIIAAVAIPNAQRAGAMPIAIGLVGVLGLAWIGFTLYLVATYGQTIGKRIMKIRIERPDGTVATFGRIFMRGFIPGLIGAVPAIGSIFALVNILMIFREDQRCLHDHIVDTVVMKVPAA
jgi:uncharacterized RDD family membrane protein YckC